MPHRLPRGAKTRARERSCAVPVARVHPTVQPMEADSANEAAIELRGLRRDFGERTAPAGLSLELAARETLLVLGPNGAGKTTLLRVLATLLRPSGGDARILGCELPGDSWKLRGKVGYVGHEPLLYRDLS